MNTFVSILVPYSRPLKCIEIKKLTEALENWDRMFADFESHEGMPAKRTTLYNWKQYQLLEKGLEAKITTEAEFGGNEWKERKDRG